MAPKYNQKFDKVLINHVKEFPLLYNPRHLDHHNFDAREVIWNKIGELMNKPATLCKGRWINMRDMMRRKIKTRAQFPDRPVFRYRYEEEMEFLMPYYSVQPETETTMEFEDVTYQSEIDSEDVKPVINPLQDVVTERANAETQINSTPSQQLDPTDNLDVFLMTIGSTLKNFSPYYLNQAKTKIFQVIQDYELRQIVSRDGQPGGTGVI